MSCADRPGIVAAVAQFLFGAGANITDSHQHAGARFHMRTEFEGPLDGLAERFAAEVAEPFGMTWRLWPLERRRRVAVLVSREDHCLVDLLMRRQRGELAMDVPLVASNHPDLGEIARAAQVEFVHVPVTPETKPAAEEALLGHLDAAGADLVVLARYMQILSAGFLDRVGVPVVNIHHSFLPAFAGADPYRRAHERGVKIIGATAHFVTPELDAGPIIEQDVARVGHGASVADLTQVGRDIERLVLARAVRWMVEDRVFLDDERTVVF